MDEFMTLRLLDRMKSVFERFGVDYPAMRLILKAKLTMDRRRVPGSLTNANRKEGSGEDNYFLKSLGLYALMGLVMVPFLFIGSSWMVQMSIVFSLLLFLLTSTFISDFSSVLLDTRDRTLLAVRPVNRATLHMARAVHVMIYMSLMTAATAAAPLLVSLFARGIPFALLFAAELVLADLLILVLTALLYLLVLQWFDGEKLKDLINMVQILLSVAIMVGYQLVSRAFVLVPLGLSFAPAWWSLLLPPLWFGAPFGWLLQGEQQPYLPVLSAMALFVPAAALLLYLRCMPAFERHLVKLASHAAPARRAMTAAGWASVLLCRTREEKAFFRFAYRMMGTEREFKLHVYPSLGFSLVFPLIFPLQNALSDGWGAMKAGSGYYTMYFCAMLIPTLILMLGHSGSYKGAWIYGAVPLRDHGAIYKGTLKAALTKLLLPLFLLEGILFTAVYGLRILPHLAAVLLTLCMYAVLCYRVLMKGLPFSAPFTEAKNGALKSLAMLLLLAAFAGVHWLSTLFTGGLYLYLVLLLAANYLVWGALGRKPPAAASAAGDGVGTGAG
ncbi:hypothetical protein [Paenibacillus caseinilyticus]|uniref:hypothetical protein n=1 Tax=Paenibacillus caseinilyticus TaxID=3098138 RepID=UPI0022B86996|nr:hypothetical protein [Paenibacillus caseinilyticus]MCZ8519902.1 hypothetical protein [Paenibacillus caseinilyticus]